MLIVYIAIAALTSVSAYPLLTHTYTSTFDNIDVTRVLTSDRLLTKYVDCLMDRGSCTPNAWKLKGKYTN